MSTTMPKLASPIKKLNSPVPGWMAKTKAKWGSRGLIAIVIAYVGILILAPLVSLAHGAFE